MNIKEYNNSLKVNFFLKCMGKKIIGYTAGVFDLFHIGHVNHLMNAKSMCDHLIVGVSTDELIANYKNKKTVVPYDQRVDVVRSCRYVDTVISQDDFDRFNLWKKLKFDVTFVGDDWFGKNKFKEIEKNLKKVGVKVIYIPYTKNISSTMVRQFLIEKGAWTGDDSQQSNENKKLPLINKNSNANFSGEELKKKLIELSNPKYNNSKVSVVIPVYKQERRFSVKLKEALKNLFIILTNDLLKKANHK